MADSAAPSTYVFGYGSLLDPHSLRRTLPEIDPGDCIPAKAGGMIRCFDVAFPNDGSQQDKAYYAADGHRPPRILLCNLRPAPGRSANGICIPVGPRELAALRDRERRYTATDVTDLVTAHPGRAAPAGQVRAFLGRAEFTRSADAARGVLSAAYRDTVLAGASYWDRQVSGFAAEFEIASTIVDIARETARRALLAGEATTAETATRTGLKACQGQFHDESLWRYLIRAAWAQGDHEEITRIVDQLHTALDDHDADPETDTVDLIDQIRATTAAGQPQPAAI